jgi:hypothetical protein
LTRKVVSWRHDVQPCTANGLGLFVVGSVLLLGYYCWECLIVGISLAKVTVVTISYCGIVIKVQVSSLKVSSEQAMISKLKMSEEEEEEEEESKFH